MKKLFFLMLIAGFVACHENGKIDKRELDKAGEKLQKTVEKGADTVGSKLQKLKNKLDDPN